MCVPSWCWCITIADSNDIKIFYIKTKQIGFESVWIISKKKLNILIKPSFSQRITKAHKSKAYFFLRKEHTKNKSLLFSDDIMWYTQKINK